MAALLVIIPDVLSDIIKKGEITPRYYNPGNLFEEVHILMTNNDKPEPQKLRSTVGNAKLFLHNIHLPGSKRTLGYKPWLLKVWARPAVKLAEKIKPGLIRCHGNWFNGFLASRINKKLGIPYVVSIHTQPEDFRGEAISAFGKKYFRTVDFIEEKTLQNADIILPVYASLLPYLKKKVTQNTKLPTMYLMAKVLRRKKIIRYIILSVYYQ
jgi:glycosyltransferase involved in cell wall biosynthesis